MTTRLNSSRFGRGTRGGVGRFLGGLDHSARALPVRGPAVPRSTTKTILLLEARDGAWRDAGKIGLGFPPLETADGWLVMYHGVHQTSDRPIYRAGLALLDLADPRTVLPRTDEWVFGPVARYEITGDVGRVVFPCG